MKTLFLFKTEGIFLEPSKVTIVILSQKEGYNAAHADYLRKNIHEQADALEGVRSLVTESFLYMLL